MPNMDNGYDKVLKQMEDEIDQLKAHFKTEEKKARIQLRLKISAVERVVGGVISHQELPFIENVGK